MRKKMSEESAFKIAMPMLVTNWIIGIGVIEYPLGHQHFIISILYSSVCLILYCYLSWYSYPYLLRMTREFDISAKGLKFIFYAHILTVIITIISGWTRRQGIISIIKHSANLDSLLEQIGVPKLNSKEFKTQILKYALGITYILLIISISSYTILFKDLHSLECGKIMTAVIIDYPTILMFIVDSTFVNLVKSASEKLKALNSSLRKLLTTTVDCPQHTKIIKLYCQAENERAHVDLSLNHIEEDIVFKLITAKKAHINLLNLCREINKTFELHLLRSITITIGIITVSLYEIQLMIQQLGEIDKLQIYRLTLHSAVWIFYYVLKLLAFSYACSSVVEQSTETGDIISEIYDEPFIGEEVQAQILDYHFILLKNDISFNAKGFVKLDFTLIQAVIAAISTYTMIITQFGNFAIPTCSNSTCI